MCLFSVDILRRVGESNAKLLTRYQTVTSNEDDVYIKRDSKQPPGCFSSRGTQVEIVSRQAFRTHKKMQFIDMFLGPFNSKSLQSHLYCLLYEIFIFLITIFADYTWIFLKTKTYVASKNSNFSEHSKLPITVPRWISLNK